MKLWRKSLDYPSPPSCKFFLTDGGERKLTLGLRYGDVKYSADGKLVIDRKKKAWTSEDLRKHVSSQLENSSVIAVTGEEVELPVGQHDVSLCCHSDSPGALEIVQLARTTIDQFNAKMGYTNN